MREEIEYLALGSIVVIKGGFRKYMILARGIQVNVNGANNFFDYGACLYPEGVIDDKVMYFQHADILKVVHEGYSDEDDKIMIENIKEAFEKLHLTHADTKSVKKEAYAEK